MLAIGSKIGKAMRRDAVAFGRGDTPRQAGRRRLSRPGSDERVTREVFDRLESQSLHTQPRCADGCGVKACLKNSYQLWPRAPSISFSENPRAAKPSRSRGKLPLFGSQPGVFGNFTFSPVAKVQRPLRNHSTTLPVWSWQRSEPMPM